MLKSFFIFIATTIILSGCGQKPVEYVSTIDPKNCPENGSLLTGAGATFPAPIYARWFSEYKNVCNIEINYQAIGSGGGISQITNKTVDFGASDGIMTSSQFSAAEGIMMIPMTSGAVAVIFNIPDRENLGIKLTPDILSDIYLGKITKWNDPRITAINGTIIDLDIVVVRRSDGSGTTNIFSDYLSKISTEWKDKVGSGNSLNWPVGVGGEGNAGVAGQVKLITGAIGYVELAYANQNRIPYAMLQNSSGNFIVPTVASVTHAMEGIDIPDNLMFMITNSSNPEAYPIAGLTWFLVYSSYEDKAKSRTLVSFMKWALTDGQERALQLEYAKLSKDVVDKALALVEKVN